eukprot:1145831-Pelagomonas_calceolata.AAC.1
MPAMTLFVQPHPVAGDPTCALIFFVAPAAHTTHLFCFSAARVAALATAAAAAAAAAAGHNFHYVYESVPCLAVDWNASPPVAALGATSGAHTALLVLHVRYVYERAVPG